MVVHIFPMAKLGALLLKQISKPIANIIKTNAKSSPVFRKYVCLPPARFYNWCEIKAKMWVLHLGKPVNIQVLNEESAIDLGANLLGEFVIFAIAAGILLNEVVRQSAKEQVKEEKIRKEREELKRTIQDLFITTEQQAAHIRELIRKVGELDTRVKQESWLERLRPSKDQNQTDDIFPLEDDDVEEPNEPKPNNPASEPKSSQNVDDGLTEPTKVPLKSDLSSTFNPRKNCRSEKKSTGLLWNALTNVEIILFENEIVRKPSVLIVALNYLYEDVYRMPITF